jgi:hypothetical protein
MARAGAHRVTSAAEGGGKLDGVRVSPDTGRIVPAPTEGAPVPRSIDEGSAKGSSGRQRFSSLQDSDEFKSFRVER